MTEPKQFEQFEKLFLSAVDADIEKYGRKKDKAKRLFMFTSVVVLVLSIVSPLAVFSNQDLRLAVFP